jgi:hypothetical protein
MEAYLYITDSSGKKFWRTTAGFGFHGGEKRNLEHHFRNIKAGMPAWQFVDAATARLVLEVDGKEVGWDDTEFVTQGDLGLLEELLAELEK